MSLINVAIIGSGGREHALYWKIKQSSAAGNVYVLPGNGGIADSVPVAVSDFKKIHEFCTGHDVSLIVVGPEVPLAEGIADYFADTTIDVFGPDSAAARLEGSKAYAKEFMQRYNVATARCTTCTGTAETDRAIETMDGCVLKYDGLAAGKGVYVCHDLSEAKQAVRDIERTYGDNAVVVVEELLVGDEISIIGVTDGSSMKLLLPSQDHKQAYDNDEGPNTGGMGAFAPVPFADASLVDAIQRDIVDPTMNGLAQERFSFVGVVYFGIMVTESGPKLLEYNVRFGDPETEVLLPALQSDLLDIICACCNGTLADIDVTFYTGYYVDLVLASGGYPGSYEKGKHITGLDRLPDDILLFHAGTEKQNGTLVTAGGRVLNVVARADTLEKAITAVYDAAERIEFEGKHYRGDIGRRKRIIHS